MIPPGEDTNWGRAHKTWFFFLRSKFNVPTEKSEETIEMEDLRKSGVTEAKNTSVQQKGALKH